MGITVFTDSLRTHGVLLSSFSHAGKLFQLFLETFLPFLSTLSLACAASQATDSFDTGDVLELGMCVEVKKNKDYFLSLF